MKYKLTLPRLNNDLTADHSWLLLSLLLSFLISLSLCVTFAFSCCIINLQSHQFFKYLDAFMNSLLKQFLFRVINFFILLNIHLYLTDITDIINIYIFFFSINV